jgi:hypothetical protein
LDVILIGNKLQAAAYRCMPGTEHQDKQDMKRAAGNSSAITILSAIIVAASTANAAPPESCRFIEARAEREACYQRQDAARLERQRVNEVRQQTEQAKPYEPMTADDAELTKAMRGICRGC